MSDTAPQNGKEHRENLAIPPNIGPVKYQTPEPEKDNAGALSLEAPDATADDAATSSDEELSDEEWLKTKEGHEYIAELVKQYPSAANLQALEEGRFGDIDVARLEKTDIDYGKLFLKPEFPLKDMNLPNLNEQSLEDQYKDALSGQKMELLKQAGQVILAGTLQHMGRKGFEETHTGGIPLYITATDKNGKTAELAITDATDLAQTMKNATELAKIKDGSSARISLLFHDNMGDMCEARINEDAPEGMVKKGCAQKVDIGVGFSASW